MVKKKLLKPTKRTREEFFAAAGGTPLPRRRLPPIDKSPEAYAAVAERVNRLLKRKSGMQTPLCQDIIDTFTNRDSEQFNPQEIDRAVAWRRAEIDCIDREIDYYETMYPRC